MAAPGVPAFPSGASVAARQPAVIVINSSPPWQAIAPVILGWAAPADVAALPGKPPGSEKTL